MIPLRDRNPTRRTPVVTIALALACFVVFGAELWISLTRGDAALEQFFDQWGAVPAKITHALQTGDDLSQPVLGMVTSLFLHASWLHIAGNMLFLWIFGNNIEDRVGRRRFLVFYVIGGLAASLLQFLAGPGSDVPNIGASGAIAAVLGGYLVLYPKAAVITYIPPIFFVPLPAVLFLIGWIILQVYAAGAVQVGSAGGGVAYYAHIGGFAFGLLTIRWWVGRNERRPAPPSAWPA